MVRSFPILVPGLLVARRRAELLDELKRGKNPGRLLTQMIVVMTLGAAFYGAVLGSWRGDAQIVYAAVKLPLVLLSTTALTLVFNWMSALILGLRLRFAQVALLSILALAVAALVLASLVPVIMLFTLSAPPASSTARATHNLLYLLHVVVVAGAGVLGVRTLRGLLEDLSGDPRRARTVHLVWLVTFAFVGGEIAWALRPFVGSIYLPVVFLRPDALDGNVYEFIVRDVLPYLWDRLTHGQR